MKERTDSSSLSQLSVLVKKASVVLEFPSSSTPLLVPSAFSWLQQEGRVTPQSPRKRKGGRKIGEFRLYLGLVEKAQSCIFPFAFFFFFFSSIVTDP